MAIDDKIRDEKLQVYLININILQVKKCYLLIKEHRAS